MEFGPLPDKMIKIATPTTMECVLELNKFVNGELQTSKVLIDSIQQSLSNLREGTDNRKMPAQFYAKVSNALEKLHCEIYEFNVNLSNHNDWFNLLNTKDLVYRHANLSEYKEHYHSNCIIVNATKDSNIISIYDIGCPDKYDQFFAILYENFKNNLYERTTVLPTTSNNEIFGVLLDNCFYRVVRKHILDNDHFLGLLIDHGKIVKLPVQDVFFLLPPDIQKIPSMAICCKIIEVDNETKKELLEDCIYKKYSFIVKKNHNDYIEISLKNLRKNPFIQDFNENEAKWFQKLYINAVSARCLSKEIKPNIDVIEDRSHVIEDCSRGSIFPKISNSSNIKNILKVSLLSQEYKFDYFENLFQYRGHGTCVNSDFKQFKEKEENSLQLSNLTIESQPPKDMISKRKVPPIGTHIFVVPTHLINVSTFYGQLITDDIGLGILGQLQSALNDPKRVENYGKFTLEDLPKRFDLVLAKFSDGSFYRAQVIQDNFDEFKVFYLDYGNELDLDYTDLRKWVKQFEYLSFQAVKFQLDNIKTKMHHNEDKAVEAENFLTQHFLNRRFLAKIVNNKNNLVIVTISSPDFKCPNNDLSDLLVIKNFAIYDPNL